jgi:hypothetical protein
VVKRGEKPQGYINSVDDGYFLVEDSKVFLAGVPLDVKRSRHIPLQPENRPALRGPPPIRTRDFDEQIKSLNFLNPR